MPVQAALGLAASAAVNVYGALASCVSPWMVAGLMINYASNIESYKKAGSLLLQVEIVANEMVERADGFMVRCRIRVRGEKDAEKYYTLDRNMRRMTCCGPH